MANKLFDSYTAPDGSELSGTVTLLAPSQRAAGTDTLAVVSAPVALTGGAFELENVPEGPYTVYLELFAGDDETRINEDRRAYKIHVAADGDQRLRDLIDLGAVADAPTAKLDAIVEAYVTNNNLLTQEVADANYVRFVDQNGNPLPPGSVTTIVINTSTGEIDDITFEEA